MKTTLTLPVEEYSHPVNWTCVWKCEWTFLGNKFMWQKCKCVIEVVQLWHMLLIISMKTPPSPSTDFISIINNILWSKLAGCSLPFPGNSEELSLNLLQDHVFYWTCTCLVNNLWSSSQLLTKFRLRSGLTSWKLMRLFCKTLYWYATTSRSWIFRFVFSKGGHK